MAKTFYIIDGSAYIFRAFFGIRELSNSTGLPTNATFGFTKMLLKLIEDKNPDYLAMTFDAKGPTFRHEMYEGYKSNRPPMPDLLVQQIPYIHQMVEALGLTIYQEQGLEADDLIGTLADLGAKAGLEVVVVTGDKDMYQLITPEVTVYDPTKNKRYTEESIREKFGINPNQIIEMMGLMGDTSDQIPGVAGIGIKTAMKLIQNFDTIENLYGRLDEIKRPKMREKLETGKEMAQLSRTLVTIKTDCELNFDLESLIKPSPDVKLLAPLCEELEFYGLLKDLVPQKYESPEVKLRHLTDETRQQALASALKTKHCAIAWETDDSDPLQANLTGLAISTGAHEALTLVLDHNAPLPEDLKPFFETEKLHLIGHGFKALLKILARQGVQVKASLFDLEIADYLLNPAKRDHSLETLAIEYLKEQVKVEQGDLFAEPKAASTSEADQLGNRAALFFRLSEKLEPQLKLRSLENLFHEIEMPLVKVLAQIEGVGVKIDSALLGAMSKELEEKLKTLTETIYSLAGSPFNINSPKQLADILFNRLGLTPIKKTKTGFSTNEEVLTRLASAHPLPAEILNSRQIVKLKSTYIDALPKLVRADTGRIHTQLKQTVAATGRLSSVDPNLQNIPVRGDMGKRIRETFIAEPGRQILSADYNQVELRILAHLSEDPALIAAFQNGEDVHKQTAVEIFSLAPEDITSEMRRVAKSVNFGIIYGISPFGLSNNLGIPMNEAKRYIDIYFSHYQGVQEFMDRTLKKATEDGYVTTLFGRRRDIPELGSSNSFTRGIGQRLAMNTPIQGTAADLIKIAMIKVQEWMQETGVKSIMTLQVHDELLFEVPEDEIDLMREKVALHMTNAANLKVPLEVDVGVGNNWSEAH